MKRRLNKHIDKPKTSFSYRLNQIGKYFLIAIAALGILTITINFIVSNSYTENIYSEIKDLPSKKVGLILGTSKYTSENRPNLFFKNRIEAAVQLYKNKKIQHIIVSGDNSHASYNEPREMLKALIKEGIPKEKIHLDFAGFRTLDSVVRAHKVFNQQSFTIISQKFHNQRAIYISKNKNLASIAFNASTPSLHYGFKTRIREFFARVKMFYDLYIIHKEPKFLGEKIEIN